ncbi:hypothetical protein CK203_042072 [Vitis vinifera]|uniref:Tf2-1-like SH3-like domain-containing protein n=1 Tax=Vitis vinifera TaxID=29760 RepID=A0A438HHH0_VITVI|nr:hypothetical protein CK203_042072 [Vitis vinifera]
MVDALSKNKVIAYITALSEVISDFNERIKREEEGHKATATPPHSKKPWESISMDFIMDSQKCRKRLGVLSHVMKHFGLPRDITNRQTKMNNALLEEYLMHYVTTTQKNWVDLLETAQLCYDLQRSSATGGWDKVLLKLTHRIWKKISSKTRQRGLIPKYDEPFEVIKRMEKVAYMLKLPESFKLQPTFHPFDPIMGKKGLMGRPCTYEDPRAWYDLPPPCISMRTLKDLCIELIGEAMGVMPWLNAMDKWLDKKL